MRFIGGPQDGLVRALTEETLVSGKYEFAEIRRVAAGGLEFQTRFAVRRIGPGAFEFVAWRDV